MTTRTTKDKAATTRYYLLPSAVAALRALRMDAAWLAEQTGDADPMPWDTLIDMCSRQPEGWRDSVWALLAATPDSAAPIDMRAAAIIHAGLILREGWLPATQKTTCACGHPQHGGLCSQRDPDDGVPCDCDQTDDCEEVQS